MISNPQVASCQLTESEQQAIQRASARIAPSWPLDQMIAVNPWWELRGESFATNAAKLAALASIKCLMPKSYYASLWLEHIQPRHLHAAAQALAQTASIEDLLDHLATPEWQNHWHNLSDWLDSHRDRQHRMAWRDEITHQVSQFCAGFFQPGSPFNQDARADCGLYRDWLEVTRQDRGIEILMGEPKLSAQFKTLPDDHPTLMAEAFRELDVAPDALDDYLHALLLDLNGWASWVAYSRWQARLQGADSACLMHELLAIRLAWELALWRHFSATRPAEMNEVRDQWQRQWLRLPRLVQAHREAQQLTWVWQHAAELAYQESLHKQLLRAHAPVASTPVLQAVFCIDVRSEPMRRALEAQHPQIQTRGFAGFFGLPLGYQPQATALARPQLPGLLRPSLQVTEQVNTVANFCEQRQRRLNQAARWQAVNEAPPAAFSLVEAAGLRYAFKLVKDTFAPGPHKHPVNDLHHEGQWQLTRDGVALGDAEQAELACGILRAMGLTDNFAPVVMLVGHGSTSRNNPHAAGLDCGACGGQTGEVNVRVLASLLNKEGVRSALNTRGIDIAPSTRFVAALHNTTSDDIQCFDESPSAEVQAWLQAASDQARAQRAGALKLDAVASKPQALARAFRQRGRDWSQVRPEWGLANNACFIVAPRAYSRHLNLAGRSFLHDYDWQQDTDFSTLELIMTAPMVVTHWINMQYNASTTDNLKYGSGNKVLHNVVGGNLGVFEGNGGDLRIGLSRQSLHDGSQWMHQPLRLSVYLAAPREAIAAIVERHAAVADLINNDWLFLLQWQPEQRQIARFYQGVWRQIEVSEDAH